MISTLSLLLAFLIGLVLARHLRALGLALTTALVAVLACVVGAQQGWLAGLLAFLGGALALQMGFLAGAYLLVKDESSAPKPSLSDAGEQGAPLRPSNPEAH